MEENKVEMIEIPVTLLGDVYAYIANRRSAETAIVFLKLHEIVEKYKASKAPVEDAPVEATE